MHMQVREIKELIKALSDSDIVEFTWEDESSGTKLSLRKNVETATAVVPAGAAGLSPPGPVPEDVISESEEAEDLFDDPRYVTITAPMVGTFYRAPAPDAAPYVEVGDQVSVGQALCIIEAMKLMNEIESEMKGRIIKILAENAEPVEYGQPLFVLEKE